MEPPHTRHHPHHHSRSKRQERKRNHELSRPNLPPEAADGNKENLIQGWLDGLEAKRRGGGAGTARPLRTAESPNHDHSPHPSYYYPPSPPTRNATSQSRPSHHGRTNEREDLDVDFGGRSRKRRHSSSIADDGHSERAVSRKRRGRSASLSPSGSSQEDDLRFQKKRRRKTRTDRYDVVKKDSVDKHKETKKPSNESKKKRQVKDTLVSTREVMDKFGSASILNERITVGIGFVTQYSVQIIR